MREPLITQPRALSWRQPPPPPRTAWIGQVAAFILGAILIYGTYAKVIDPIAFTELISAKGLDFLLPAPVVAALALALEAGLGLALLLNMRHRYVLLPTAGLVLFFLYITGRAYAAALSGNADAAASCGCFGNLVERTPAQAFWTDLALFVPTLALSFIGRPTDVALPRVRLELVGAFTLVVLAVAWKAPDLPLDNIATRMHPGKALTDMCAGADEERFCFGDLMPELAVGEHLLILADLEDSTFRHAVPALNRAVEGQSAVGIWVVTPVELPDIKRFMWAEGPIFTIRHAPMPLLRPLFRRLPRAALVRDGAVIETYDGVPTPDRFLPDGVDLGGASDDLLLGGEDPMGGPEDEVLLEDDVLLEDEAPDVDASPRGDPGDDVPMDDLLPDDALPGDG